MIHAHDARATTNSKRQSLALIERQGQLAGLIKSGIRAAVARLARKVLAISGQIGKNERSFWTLLSPTATLSSENS